MLKPAFFYKEKLNEAYSNIVYNEEYKYFIETIWDYEIEVDISDKYKIQLVSINENIIYGYFSATLDRINNIVTGLEAIRFSESLNSVFSIDFHHFIKELTSKHGFRKITFEVICGSPFEKLYDKHLPKYNGRLVGIRKQEVRLCDGKFYDVKIYELLS